MPLHWGQALATLVSSCWAQDPDYRPSAREVLIRANPDPTPSNDPRRTLPLQPGLSTKHRQSCYPDP